MVTVVVGIFPARVHFKEIPPQFSGQGFPDIQKDDLADNYQCDGAVGRLFGERHITKPTPDPENCNAGHCPPKPLEAVSPVAQEDPLADYRESSYGEGAGLREAKSGHAE